MKYKIITETFAVKPILINLCDKWSLPPFKILLPNKNLLIITKNVSNKGIDNIKNGIIINILFVDNLKISIARKDNTKPTNKAPESPMNIFALLKL